MKEILEIMASIMNDLKQGDINLVTIVRIIFVFVWSISWVLGKIKNQLGKNLVMGIEDYSTRKKARFLTCLNCILLFVIVTLILGTYNIWIKTLIAGFDVQKSDIGVLGLLYLATSLLIFVLWLIWLLYVFFKKTTKGMDKYEKNHANENIRFVTYIWIGMFLLGLAIIKQNVLFTIEIIVVIFLIGIMILFLFDYEADRALIYIKDGDSKLYIYRTLDSDSLLCGRKKNALSCTSYIVVNKKDILLKELFVVDREQCGVSEQVESKVETKQESK